MKGKMPLKNITKTEVFFLVFWVVCLILGFASLSTEKKVTRNDEMGEFSVLEPSSLVTLEDGTAIYQFDGVEWKAGYDALMFYGSHQDIYVKCDGQQVYSRERVNSIFGHTTGSTWNVLTVPTGTKQVEVSMIPVYGKDYSTTITFYQGNMFDMLVNRMHSSAFGTLVCMMILVIGICLVIYWGITVEFRTETRELLYLGLLAITMGVWAIGETDVIQILMENRLAGSYIAFSCLMLLSPLAILFTREFVHMKDRFVHKILIYIEMGVGIVAVLLQMLNLVDFKEIAFVIQGLMLLSLGYWIAGVVVSFRRRTDMRTAVSNLVGMIILVITAMIDLILYYVMRESANHSTKVGFLIYVIILGTVTARKSREILADKRQMEVYREMATKDFLSNCYNRNAFNQDMEEIKNPEKWAVITFDLNNLKLVNDTQGHKAGDEYIQGASRLIRTIFAKYGKAYRTGGDEFVVLSKKLKERQIEALLHKLYVVSEYSIATAPVSGLGVAAGYAMFDSKQDETLTDTCARADVKMYERKKELKAKRTIG